MLNSTTETITAKQSRCEKKKKKVPRKLWKVL